MTARTGRTVAATTVAMVLGATVVTLAAGALVKAPCAAGDWADGRQYRRLCYSDIVPLYGTERLAGGRLPYLDPCTSSPDVRCDEYPVLTMYFMRAAAWVGRGYAGFFYANAALLGICALVAARLLERAAGLRALYFALAPTLLLSGFVNWDLLAVALTAGATLAHLRGRDRVAGILLGLGAAAKLYPALLVIPFALGRAREGRTGGAATLVVWAGLTWTGVDLPFALLAPAQWATFFRFNLDRPADFDSLWYLACHRLHLGCSLSPHLLDRLSLLALVGGAILLWWARRARDPGFPRWSFGFPLLVAFLLSSKVYSPQFSLWVVPWFGLALPNRWAFAAFELTDASVFVTRFSWFGQMSGLGGASEGVFQAALVARAAVLLACLALWTLARTEEATGTTRRTRGEPEEAVSPSGRPGP